MSEATTAIVDIGSNSVRLVVYNGPRRAPMTLFNEKVTAGLGNLRPDGTLEPKATRAALRGLARFAWLAEAMGVAEVRTVATAAVRDASDGAVFLDQVRALGLPIELLSGEQEAVGAGLGVISAIPEADGIVGDLGGGSLELVRIRHGRVERNVSMPLGVLRVPALRGEGPDALENALREGAGDGWEPGLPFYLVGGSWRALARLHMHLIAHPLPVLHNYVMPPAAAAHLVRVLAEVDRKRLKAIPELSSARIPQLGDAAALMTVLEHALRPSGFVVSAFGLREGLLYSRLTADIASEDPLLAATRAAGGRQGRFGQSGDLLDAWIAPLFAGQPDARLRHAACLLADVAWSASPEFRAERGLDIALHGAWVGIDARGRAMVAQALFASFGGGGQALPVIAALSSPEERATATNWGLAMRLGQRLGGGVSEPLAQARLTLDDGAVTLALDDPALYGESVERRHKHLAAALARQARVERPSPPITSEPDRLRARHLEPS